MLVNKLEKPSNTSQKQDTKRQMCLEYFLELRPADYTSRVTRIDIDTVQYYYDEFIEFLFQTSPDPNVAQKRAKEMLLYQYDKIVTSLENQLSDVEHRLKQRFLEPGERFKLYKCKSDLLMKLLRAVDKKTKLDMAPTLANLVSLVSDKKYAHVLPMLNKEAQKIIKQYKLFNKPNDQTISNIHDSNL